MGYSHVMAAKRSLNPVALALGCLFVVAFIKFGEPYPYRHSAGSSFRYLGVFEMRFWLAHLFFLVPGCFLMAVGIAPGLGASIGRLWRRLPVLRPKQRVLLFVGFGFLLLFVAVIGRDLVLLGLPITDGENATRFGGQILASGKLAVPILEPDGGFAQRFTHRAGTWVSSNDYPGAIGFAALAELTIGSLLYAFAAAATGLLVVASASVVAGNRGALVAAVFWLTSPMAQTLSMTTHSQLVSRLFVASAVLFYLLLVVGRDTRKRIGAGFGAFAGLAIATRSLEAGAVVVPLVLHVSLCAWRTSFLGKHRSDGQQSEEPESTTVARFRRAIGSAGLAFASFLALFALYNWTITGNPLIPAQYSDGSNFGVPYARESVLNSFTFNGAFNWMLFAIAGLGPIGTVLAFSTVATRRWTKALGYSALAMVGVSSLHGDTGIHTLGPVHYAELSVVVTILAAFSFVHLAEVLKRHVLPRQTIGLAVASATCGSMLIFTIILSAGLSAQAYPRRVVLDFIAKNVEPPAIVVGKPPVSSFIVAESGPIGTWVKEWPYPDPALSDPILYLRPRVVPADVRAAFPDRNLYQVEYADGEEPVRVRLVPRGPIPNPKQDSR